MSSISIHALREEGDVLLFQQILLQGYFYPRPPRGGRRIIMDAVGSAMKFLSTPSARRATGEPPQLRCHGVISIHALREEGDCISLLGELLLGKFLSTPSARRATRRRHHYRQARRISIHALREEGDASCRCSRLVNERFLSTPSARRATSSWSSDLADIIFLSTPSARRATVAPVCSASTV